MNQKQDQQSNTLHYEQQSPQADYITPNSLSIDQSKKDKDIDRQNQNPTKEILGEELKQQAQFSKEFHSTSQMQEDQPEKLGSEVIKQQEEYLSVQKSQLIQSQNLNYLSSCQQAFYKVLKLMIDNTINNQKFKQQSENSLKNQISDYIQLFKKLQKNDRTIMDKQENELLKFFKDWFEYDEEIEQIKKKELSNNNKKNQEIQDVVQGFDFEEQCLQCFLKYISTMQKDKLDELKAQYQKEETLNNWKNIKDTTKANDIQVFAMFQQLKRSDQRDQSAKYYIKWWFQWNQTQVFQKAKEEADAL